MDIREIRALTGLSAQKFGNMYGIPLRTIQNWEGGVSTPPPYLVKLLERVVKEDIETPSGDLISREETLTAFADYVGRGMSMNDYDALWDIVVKMSPVKQPRFIAKSDGTIEQIKEWEKTGRWIDGHCSECGCDIPAYIIDWKWQKDMDAKYCPNCGAKMEKEDKEKA